MSEKKYEREEVVAVYGNSGMAPMYFPERPHDKFIFSRNAMIAGAIIVILIILANILIFLSMTGLI